jgi:hypothetical protein
MSVFLKNQCCDQIFEKISYVLSKKTPIFFADFFGENILKIITSVPGHPGSFTFVLNQPERRKNKRPIKAVNVNPGDQIGRIFAFLAIVYFWQFLNRGSSPIFRLLFIQ